MLISHHAWDQNIVLPTFFISGDRYPAVRDVILSDFMNMLKPLYIFPMWKQWWLVGAAYISTDFFCLFWLKRYSGWFSFSTYCKAPGSWRFSVSNLLAVSMTRQHLQSLCVLRYISVTTHHRIWHKSNQYRCCHIETYRASVLLLSSLAAAGLCALSQKKTLTNNGRSHKILKQRNYLFM